MRGGNGHLRGEGVKDISEALVIAIMKKNTLSSVIVIQLAVPGPGDKFFFS